MTGRLADRTWAELDSRSPVVLLPLGSCEQHGPHLPLDTDTAVATAVSERALALLHGEIDAVIAPAQNYGASGEHEDFPGTVSIGHTALHLLVVELGRSMLRWAGRLVVVNGHGGNVKSLAGAVLRLRDEGRDVAWWACAGGERNGHAGRSETSMMHTLRPSGVRGDQIAAGAQASEDDLLERLMAGGVRAVSRNGVIGDPTGAGADEGAELLAGMSTALATAMRDWQIDSTGRLKAVAGVVTS